MQQSNQPLNSNEKRRDGSDRRRFDRQHNFPFVDGHGYLVTEERRCTADRRKHQK